MEITAGERRRAHTRERDLRLAWHAALMMRMKQMPTLAEVLQTRPRVQTLEEQRAALSVIRAQLGNQAS